VREPAPFVTRWRSRTVANGDSIMFEVRRCFQCSAGKSKKVRSASASCSRVVTAFGYLAPYSVPKRVIASRACARVSAYTRRAQADGVRVTASELFVDLTDGGTVALLVPNLSPGMPAEFAITTAAAASLTGVLAAARVRGTAPRHLPRRVLHPARSWPRPHVGTETQSTVKRQVRGHLHRRSVA
jgi:hypothetical protein